MATQSPFPFVDALLERLGGAPRPPDWLVQEIQQRVVLMLNHVLMQEPQAQQRLARQTGRVLEARWRMLSLRLAATPAGLLELAPTDRAADLDISLTEDSPWALAQAALQGERPPVRIAGDVQFAAEVNWLVDHVRWDLEEDLSRLIGDAPAHTALQGLRRMGEALRQFAPRPGAGGTGNAGPSAGPGQAGA